METKSFSLSDFFIFFYEVPEDIKQAIIKEICDEYNQKVIKHKICFGKDYYEMSPGLWDREAGFAISFCNKLKDKYDINVVSINNF